MQDDADHSPDVVLATRQVPEPGTIDVDVPTEQAKERGAEDLMGNVIQPPVGEREKQHREHQRGQYHSLQKEAFDHGD